ncbi:LysR substrate-binding domain-containing protein [Undibacterium sp.]|uniref:LysR substrate-binding domain-containing protein n=1 Tax=Undibacterium sp. TaxID=1914977 RepID=UPI00374D71D8
MRAPHHLNALRAFEAVARHLSYVGAAEELNVTPAAIGQLVRGLEENLGVTLFHRSQSGPARLELTDEAIGALPDLQTGFDCLSSAVARLKASASRTAIAVTVPAAFADKWLLSRVEAFQTLYPLYELRIDTNSRIVDFTADRVDVGIRYGAGHWPGLVATRLLRDDFFPVCSPSLASGNPSLQSAADLRHHPLIHDMSMRNESRFPTWRSWLAKAGIKGVDSSRGLQINDSAAVIQAAIAGNGVALGRTSLVEKDLAAGRLVRPFGDAQPHEFAYYIVHRKGGASPGVAEFRDWLLGQVSGA